jgi:hypothetical protein
MQHAQPPSARTPQPTAVPQCVPRCSDTRTRMTRGTPWPRRRSARATLRTEPLNTEARAATAGADATAGSAAPRRAAFLQLQRGATRRRNF